MTPKQPPDQRHMMSCNGETYMIAPGVFPALVTDFRRFFVVAVPQRRWRSGSLHRVAATETIRRDAEETAATVLQ